MNSYLPYNVRLGIKTWLEWGVQDFDLSVGAAPFCHTRMHVKRRNILCIGQVQIFLEFESLGSFGKKMVFFAQPCPDAGIISGNPDEAGLRAFGGVMSATYAALQVFSAVLAIGRVVSVAEMAGANK